MAAAPARASRLDGIRFAALVVLPNLVQGLFRRRRWAVRLATDVDVDGRAIAFLNALRRRSGAGPIWIEMPGNAALFVQDSADIRRVLGSSPEPFASDPPTKRRGMVHFQPDALTISRGARWRERRRVTAAVLDTSAPIHRFAGRFSNVVVEEVAALLEETARARRGELGWAAFHDCFGRIARRVIFGDAARNDLEMSRLLARLMAEANSLPKSDSPDLEQLLQRIRHYIDRAEGGSLVSLFADAEPEPDTVVEGQVPHWMFASHDTLAANVYRALALIVSHPAPQGKVREELAAHGSHRGMQAAAAAGSLSYTGACLQDAMRLYPTTTTLSREAVTDVAWDGANVPVGSVLLISNTFNHRDRERHEFADRFTPEHWLDPAAVDDWSFNQFSHGPQACPGAGLAMLLGTTALGALLIDHEIRLLWPKVDPQRPLPYMLDIFRVRFAVDSVLPRTRAGPRPHEARTLYVER